MLGFAVPDPAPPGRSSAAIQFTTGLVMSAIVAVVVQRPVSDPATPVLVAVHVAALPLVLWHVATVVSGGTWLPLGPLGYVALVGAYSYATWHLRDTPFRWVGYFLGGVAVVVGGIWIWVLATAAETDGAAEGDEGGAP